jgi:hypothetical protein
MRASSYVIAFAAVPTGPSTSTSGLRSIGLKSLGFAWIVSSGARRRNSSVADEAIFRFQRRTPETAVGYHTDNENG